MELRVIIAGSRGFNDFSKLHESVSKILFNENSTNSEIDKIKIISGTARGADKLGEQFAHVCGYDLVRFPADWDTYGKSAGYRRNADMAKYASEQRGMLIAFWDGKSRGTKHMIDLANKYGLEVHVVNF